jgi:hypothetical protein
MMKKLYILSLLFGLFSCKGENAKTVQIEHNHIEFDDSVKIQFTDIIPENTPDSIKVSIIDQIISNIDGDSSLVKIETVDSLKTPIIGLFRNDSLLRIYKGHYPNNQKHPMFADYSYTTYYFIKDTVVYSKTECRVSQVSGRCSSVYISEESYYYNGQLIYETVDDQTGDGLCGCGRLLKPRKGVNYDYIKELKKIINTTNKP